MVTKLQQAAAGRAIDELVRAFQNEHAGTTYEDACRAVLDANPELAATYALPEVAVMPVGPSQSVRDELHDAAGEGLLDLARQYQLSHPGVSVEQAIRETVKNHEAVAGVYLHSMNPLLIVEEI